MSSSTHYQEKTRKENRNKIISIINQKPLTFTEIIRQSGLSRGVVNRHLKKLEEEEIIKKEYREGKILNLLLPNEKLSSEGKKSTEPILFTVDALPYILGLNIFLKEIGNNLSTVEIRMEKADMKTRIELIGKRLGIFYLFALMKTLEENNADWLKEAGSLLNNVDYNSFVWIAFSLSKNKAPLLSSQKAITEQAGEKIDWNLTKVENKDIATFKNLLKQIYPQEFKELENVLKGQKNYEHHTPNDSPSTEPR
jgi:DNA-binding transcriptional ArsR family regulator